MQISDVPIVDLVHRWFGVEPPSSELPAFLDWFPDRLKRTYRSAPQSLWRERSSWKLEAPRKSSLNDELAIFMTGDEGEWGWAFDVNDVERLFDIGDEEGSQWTRLEADLADIVAQRNILEIAYGPASHKLMSSLPEGKLPDLVVGMTEVTTVPWRQFPGLRLFFGDDLIVAVHYAPSSPDDTEKRLRVVVASPNAEELERIDRNVFPGQSYLLPRRWPVVEPWS